MLACGVDGGGEPRACATGAAGAFVANRDGGVASAWSTADPAVRWTCPAGWTRDADDACVPTLRSDCPAGSLPLPDGSCTATADVDCPSTPFADVAVERGTSRALYVDGSANATGADGSAAHPWTTIGAAVSAAASGEWLLVARGTYHESVDVTGNLHLIGVCAARVVIAADPGSTVPNVHAHGSTAQLDMRGVTLTGGSTCALISQGARGTLRSIHATNCLARGVEASAGSVTVTDMAIEGVRCDSLGRCRGAQADMGGSLDASRIAIVGSHGVGLYALQQSHLTISDAMVRGSAGETVQSPGEGVHIADGATLAGSRIVAEGNHQAAIAAYDARTTVTLTDVVARQSAPRSDGLAGVGLLAFDGASVSATRSLLDDNVLAGVYVSNGASLDLSDAVVRGTVVPAGSASFGSGVVIDNGRGHLARIRAVGNAGAGVLAELHAMLAMEDVDIVGSQPVQNGTFGYGLSVSSGATATFRRLLILDTREVAINAFDATTALSGSDLLILGVVPGRRGLGMGLAVYAESGATIERAAFEHVSGAAIASIGSNNVPGGVAGGPIVLDDVFVRDVRSSTLTLTRDGLLPAGRTVAYGAHATVRGSIAVQRGVFASGGFGFYVSAGSGIALTDVLVTGQLDSFGARDESVDTQVSLTRTSGRGNANDEVIQDGTLPSGSALPPPTPVCAGSAGCR